MRVRTADVCVNGAVVVTYLVRWQGEEDTPSEAWIRRSAVGAACEEGLLADADAAIATVSLGPMGRQH